MDFESPQVRVLITLFALVSTFLIFSTTERCFENADVKNAITMTQTLRASDQALTIPEALCKKHQGVQPTDITWSGTLTDSFYGFVRVRAAVPAPNQVQEYFFDVDLSAQRLHPATENSKALMQSLRDGQL